MSLVFKFTFLFCVINALATSIASAKSCFVGTIIAKKEVTARQFRQKGVGTFFSVDSKIAPTVVDGTDKGLFILTAAHVVAQAQQISIQCNGKKQEAHLVGMSETLDVAVLRVSKTLEWAKSAFAFYESGLLNARVENAILSLKMIYPERGQEASPIEVSYLSKRVTDHPLLGVTHALLSQTAAARPGVSGSPIFERSARLGEEAPVRRIGEQILYHAS